jgi:putative transposase
MARRKHYTTDLTDEQWKLIKPLIPPARRGGDRRTTNMREVVNAILYLNKNGCTWRDLPGDFPAWPTVYRYFSLWRDDGTWKAIYETLHRRWRKQVGRQETPSAGAGEVTSPIDSQSVQAAEEAETRGKDTNKRVSGRKRHLMVDTEGLPVAVAVTKASANDKSGARLLLETIKGALPRLRKLWADGAYVSAPLAKEAGEQDIEIEVVSRRDGDASKKASGFVVVPRRWVVERTFAWLLRCRRLCRDFERLGESVEALIYVAMTRLLLNRLCPRPKLTS